MSGVHSCSLRKETQPMIIFHAAIMFPIKAISQNHVVYKHHFRRWGLTVTQSDFLGFKSIFYPLMCVST